VSRDYYDLALEFFHFARRTGSEIEPNDSAKTATEIAQGIVIIGAIASQKDVDYFSLSEPARISGVWFASPSKAKTVGQLRLVLQQRDGMMQKF
jgi:hypothetical protein